MAGELLTSAPESEDGLNTQGHVDYRKLFPNEISPESHGVSLYDEVFARDEKGQLNQHLVGSFFREAVEIDQMESIPDWLRNGLHEIITPELLNTVADESSINRWDAENVEAALQAYTRFQTLESKYGEEQARSLYRQIAQEMIIGREVDEMLENVASEVGYEERGVAIYLGTRGAEMVQTVAKIAYRNTSKDLNATTNIATYYRDHLLPLNPFDDEYDPDGDLVTIAESIADLARVEGSARGNVELNVKGKVNKKNRISVAPATPNVGGHIVAGVGMGMRQRYEDIKTAGIEYDKPRRANAFREIQLPRLSASTLISLGDGAYPEMQKALEFSTNYNTPTIFLVQNNEVAIGVENNESVKITDYWKKGRGIGIPGVRTQETEMDTLYLALEFATKRALRDAGPSIVEAKTVRLLPHSSQHGDHLTSEYLSEVKNIFDEYTTSSTANELQQVFAKEVVKPAQSDNQLKLRGRLTKIIDSNHLIPEITEKIRALRDKIVDPVDETIHDLITRGFVTPEDINNWEKDAKQRVSAIHNEVMSRPRVQPEDALEHVRLETPSLRNITDLKDRLYDRDPHEKLSLTGAEAIRLALSESMAENPNLLVWGTDVFKGLSIDRGDGGELRYTWQGGYFKQEDDLFKDYGHQPLRVMNTPIAENDVSKLAFGFTTTTTNPDSLQHTARSFIDFQYADYGIQNFESTHVLGDLLWSTSEQMGRPTTFHLPSGAVKGGGPRHGDEVTDIAYAMNNAIDVLYFADSESFYKGIRYNTLYSFNPTIIMTDKKMFGGPRQEFEFGTGFMEPGRARVIKEGYGNLQILTYGPMLNATHQALKMIDDPHITDQVSVLDVYSIRPLPEDDIYDFLHEGNKFGKILFTHEEPKKQGWGNNHLKSAIWDADSRYWNLIRRRSPYVLAGADIPGVPTDGKQMDLTIPNAKKMEEKIRELIQR